VRALDDESRVQKRDPCLKFSRLEFVTCGREVRVGTLDDERRVEQRDA